MGVHDFAVSVSAPTATPRVAARGGQTAPAASRLHHPTCVLMMEARGRSASFVASCPSGTAGASGETV